MAIQQQGNYSLYYDCDRPFVHKFICSNSDTVNLVYILQVEHPVTNAWSTVTGHIKQPIEWGAPYFLIDPSQLCTDFVRWEIAQNLGAWNNTTNIFYGENHRIKCRFKLTEDTIDPVTGAIEYNNDESTWLVGQHFYCVDGGVTHEQTFNEAQHEWFYPWYLYTHNWSGGGLGTCKFMTDQPSTLTECYTDNKYVSFATEFADIYLEVDLIRKDGTTHNSLQVSDAVGKKGVTQLGVGFPQLETYLTGQGTWGTYHTVTNPIISITYRMVSGGIHYSQDYTTQLKECGCDSEYVRLWWRSNRNGVDSYTFKGTHSVRLSTSNQTFQKVLGYRRSNSEDTTDNTYQHNTFNQQSSGAGKVNIVSRKTIKLISNWENGEMLDWLSNIINSTNVFIEDKTSSDGLQLTPVTITSKDFQVKGLNDKLGKIEINLTYSNQRTTSRT